MRNEPMGLQTPFISLLLATYGRSEDIGRFVAALQGQTCRDLELIFADQNLDGRVTPYVEQARALGFAVRHLRLDKPNLSAARNAALMVATGEWVAFPDDDCWYEPETLAAVRHAAQNRSQVGAFVICWVEHYDAGCRPSPDQRDRLTLDAWRRFRGGDASSITLFMRREAVVRVGGFDERLGVGQFYGAGEETDLILRLLTDGVEIMRLSSARVHHAFSTAIYDVNWRRTLARERGTGALYAKHRLSLRVRLRGFVAPMARALINGQGWTGLKHGWAQVLGRWQGWSRWS